MGFINSGINQIRCLSCKTTITIRDHYNFSNDIVGAKRMMDRIKNAHTSNCIFKISQKPGDEKEQKLMNFP